NMGGPMSARLVDAGYSVLGYDLVAGARQAFADAGGELRDTLAEVVRGSELLILMLPDSHAVESVLGDEEVAAALSPGEIVVDMSSSEPVTTRSLAARLDADGVVLVDAPV